MRGFRCLIFVSLGMLGLCELGASQSTPVLHAERSTGAAVAMGLAGILVPAGAAALLRAESEDAALGLALISWVLGPSPGLFYADNEEGAWRGMGLRLGMMGLAVGGAVIMAAASLEFLFNSEENEEAVTAGLVLALFGGAVTVTSWVRDLRAIPSSVGRANARVRASPVVGRDGRVGAQLQLRW